MRKVVCIALLNLLLLSFASAQDSLKDELLALAHRISKNSSLKEVKETLSLAEKAFQTKVKNFDKKQSEYADALLQLADVRKKAFAVLGAKLNFEGGDSAGDRLKYLDFHHQNAAKLLKTYEEAIGVYENSGVENTQRAQAYFELGWLYDEYSSPKKKPETLSDKNASVKKTQDLYSKAFGLREKLLGKTDEATLVTMVFLAESYLKGGNFEQAMALYENALSRMEQKFGRKFEPLLPVLLSYRSLLWTIGRFEEMPDIEKHISEITGKKENLPIGLLNLSLRARNLDYSGLRESEGNVTVTLNAETWYGNANRLRIVGENTEMRTPPKVQVAPGSGLNETRITRSYVVRILVDENGKVIEAKVEKADEKTAKKIEEIVLKWAFVPFNYEGTARKMSGFVYYTEVTLLQ